MRISQYIIKHLAGTILFFLVLFISAGNINYWQGLILFQSVL